MTLHIINGDAFTSILHGAGIIGDILPWRDILHEGPVPPDNFPDHFHGVRADYIASRGWASYDNVRSMFDERERILSQAASNSEIVLWFDPDLYDQLQLVQVLARICRITPAPAIVSLVATNHPGIHNAEEIRSLFAQRTIVTSEQYACAQRTWQAITAASPENMLSILRSDDLAEFPWLGAALRRYLEEFPNENNGLSRTERTILRCTTETPSLLDAFSAVQDSEEHPFLGDTVFASYVEKFCTSRIPLLELKSEEQFTPLTPTSSTFWYQQLQLTSAGTQVMQHHASNIALNGIDRYVGGVHIKSGEPIWYQNKDGMLIKK